MKHRRHPVVLSFLVLAFLALALLPPALSSAPPGNSPHGTLSISTSGNITTVVIYNPPINLFDHNVGTDLFLFLSSLVPANRTTPPPKVVIFRSGDPDLFISHIDLYTFLPPATPEKTALLQLYTGGLSLLKNLTTTVFIGELNGETSAAGSEWLVQMDMRFAGPKARLGSLETSLGLTMAAGGLQYLSRLTNKGRAAQYLLSGDSMDCKTGKRLGVFNDCFASQKKLEDFVLALAKRIALRPEQGLQGTKASLQSLDPPANVLGADIASFAALVATPVAQALMQKLLVLDKNQTRSPFELGLDATLAELFT